MPSISKDVLGRPFCYIDPASGRKEAKRPGARSALVVACYAPPAFILVLHTWAARASTTEITDQVFLVNQLYNPAQIALETAGQQYLLYSHIVDEAVRRGIRLPLVEGKQYTEDAKDARIKETIQPLSTQGRLCFQSHQTMLRDELADFPRGATKDLLDALAGCISLIPKPQPVLAGQDSRQAVLDYLNRAHVGPRARAHYESTLLRPGTVIH
jgi:hypothetical protein